MSVCVSIHLSNYTYMSVGVFIWLSAFICLSIHLLLSPSLPLHLYIYLFYCLVTIFLSILFFSIDQSIYLSLPWHSDWQTRASLTISLSSSFHFPALLYFSISITNYCSLSPFSVLCAIQNQAWALPSKSIQAGGQKEQTKEAVTLRGA